MTNRIINTSESRDVQQAVNIANNLDEARRLSLQLRVALDSVERAIEADRLTPMFSLDEVKAIRGTQKLVHDAINRQYTAWLDRAVARGQNA